MQVFAKKTQKNLVNSKKSSTFAPAFVRKGECRAVARGAIAQLVEQRTENPCVTGSIPVGTTKRLSGRFFEKVQLFSSGLSGFDSR